jgi:nicotinate-nucleotide adenylyltransferase
MSARVPPFGDRRRRAVGLLGGSFNPAHAGHVHVSREAARGLGLDQVWWLVSPQNPLKPAAGMAALADRLARARALARGRDLVVSDLEVRLGATRTAAVIAALKRRYPRLTFVWLMGADNLAQISRWWRWPRLFRAVRVAVIDRSPYSYAALFGPAATRLRRRRTPARRLVLREPPAWSFLAVRRHPASATALRRAGGSAQ